MKRWDRRALEGLPLKLMIVSLLISLSTPMVLNSMERYEASVAESALASQAHRIAEAATEALTSGPGNVRIVQVSIPVAMAKSDAHLEVGGPAKNVTALSIRCWVNGHQAAAVFMSDPPVRVITAGEMPLRIGPGTTDIVLSCTWHEGRVVVTAEAGS